MSQNNAIRAVVQVRAALAAETNSGRSTVKALADAIGVHPVTLSRFKAGAIDLGLGTLAALAAVLDLEIVAEPVSKAAKAMAQGRKNSPA